MTKPTKCARASCQSTLNVVCRHTQTGAMYCRRCARKINEHNPGLVEMPKRDAPAPDLPIAWTMLLQPSKRGDE